MTKEAGFLETIVKDSKTVSTAKTSSNQNEVKTEASLFDSMLKNAKNIQEESRVTQANGTVVNESKTSVENPKTTTSENKTQDVQSSKNLLEKEENTLKTNTKSPSFFDKLIQETLNTTQTNAESDDLQNLNKALETQKGTDKNPLLEKEKDLSQENKTHATTQANPNKQEVSPNQSNTSLMDKLVQQANTSIQNETQIPKVLENQTTEENVSAKPTLVENLGQNVENTKVATQNNEHNTQTNQAVPTTSVDKESVAQSNTQQTTGTPPSLLDKLLQEANAQIQNEITKNTALDSSEAQTLKTTQVKEVENKIISTSQEQQSVQVKEVITKEVTLNTEKTTTVQTQVVKENITVLASNVNEKVANELTKISENNPSKVNLTKEDVVALKGANEELKSSEKEPSKSLLDRLLDENKANKISQENSVAAKTTLEQNSGKLPSESLLNNIYLSSLNKASQNAFLEKTHEVKTLVANASSVKEVQKGAEALNLGLQSSEIIVEEEQFKENVKNEFLNKLSVTRDIIKHDITKMSEEIVSQSKTVKNEAMTAATNNLINTSKLPEVEVTVSSTAAYNIENRIIGARQHMNSMMSDMARNMYLNYKPPVTAFRMNLNPGNLGSIAVLIKNDKESGLSISLNMSNVATLDSFVDNQAALRAALAKNFNTNTNINLEFNMQDGGQQQSNNGQHNKKQQQNHQATNDILESLNNNSESNNKITNYM
ncbi:MAG: flagellar hook-length control protein FliK [Arcobacteraceae bacterium]|nr:flagellar hook-length control protein FliK [Arcobacteraceae bacterium]